jgi:hypothetical protein
MSFAGLVAHLGTLTRNIMRVPLRATHRFTLFTKPTPLQEAAFRLLNLEPIRVQCKRSVEHTLRDAVTV